MLCNFLKKNIFPLLGILCSFGLAIFGFFAKKESPKIKYVTLGVSMLVFIFSLLGIVAKSFYSYVCCCCCKKDKDTIALEKGQGYLNSINEELEVLNILDNPEDNKKYDIFKKLKSKYSLVKEKYEGKIIEIKKNI